MSNRLARGAALLTLLIVPAALAQQQQRLGYQQEQLLKDASYFLDQVEGIVEEVQKQSATWKAGDPAVPLDKVNGMLSATSQATQYLTNAGNRFKQLPAENAKVAEEQKRFDAAKTSLAAAEAKLNGIKKGVDAVVKQGEGDDYKADFKRLQEINQMYANERALQERPAQAVEAARQIAGAKAERQRIATKYDALLKQPTGEAQHMREVLTFSDQVFAKYEKSIADFLATAPAAAEKMADDVVTLAKEGVKEDRPGYFGEFGGVRTQMASTQEFLKVLVALAPNAATTKHASAKVAEAQASVEKEAANFFQAIIKSRQAPPENYAGQDLAELIGMLKAKWAKEGNGTAVLKVGVIGPQWARETKWAWNGSNAWEKVDRSRLQGFVVAKHGDAEAAIWPINFVKDHAAGDAITMYFLNDPTADPGVQGKMLLSNVK